MCDTAHNELFFYHSTWSIWIFFFLHFILWSCGLPPLQWKNAVYSFTVCLLASHFKMCYVDLPPPPTANLFLIILLVLVRNKKEMSSLPYHWNMCYQVPNRPKEIHNCKYVHNIIILWCKRFGIEIWMDHNCCMMLDGFSTTGQTSTQSSLGHLKTPTIHYWFSIHFFVVPTRTH